MIEIQDFEPHSPVPQDTIDRYRGRVPDDLIDLWQRYGYGSFGRGFFRIIDPDAYLASVGPLIAHVDDDGADLPSIPMMATGLADLICWEPGDVGLSALLFRSRTATGLGLSLDTMFTILNHRGIDQYGSRKLGWEAYPEAVASHGALAYGESFVRAAAPTTFERHDTIAAIAMLVAAQGRIEH